MPTARPGNEQVVVFEICGQVCGLPLGAVQEIVPMCELAQPPGLPPVLGGLLNLRGAATPVIRTDRLFGLPPIVFHAYSQIIVLRGPAPLALLSDRVLDVITVPSGPAPAPRGAAFNECLAAVLPAAQGAVHLLRVEKLLLAQERQRLSELQKIAQRRLAMLEEAGT